MLFTHRSAAVRGGARAGARRTSRATRRCSRRPRRSSARDAAQRRVPAAHRRAPGRSSLKRGIISKDMAEQTRARRGRDGGARQGGQGRDRRARRRSSRRSSRPSTTRRCQLSYTVISSPIDGRTGNLTVKAGNLVTANGSRADHDLADRSPSTSRSRSRPCTCRRSSSTWVDGELPVTATPQDADAQAGRRAASPSSTTPSTRRPTRSS